MLLGLLVLWLTLGSFHANVLTAVQNGQLVCTLLMCMACCITDGVLQLVVLPHQVQQTLGGLLPHVNVTC